MLLLLLAGLASSQGQERTGDQGPRVKSAMGWLEGTYMTSEPGNRQFAAYQGIPYAVPPIMRLRFQPPMKHNNFYKPHEPLLATKPPSACPQLEPMSGEFRGSEDCLYLSVFTPQLESMAGSERVPVMVWIHGGNFQWGSGSSEHYGPQRILDKEVIMVSINYRLGPLGFLTTGDQEAPPNLGILDQQMALRWVRSNIAAFGGDPHRVTIFGGGASVMAHIASPYSKDLFQQAIAMSGVWGETPSLHLSKPASTYATSLATSLHCEALDSTTMVDCLRKKSAKDLLTKAAALRTFSLLPEPFKPSVDSYMGHPVLPQPLHQVWGEESDTMVTKVPLMIGATQHEGIPMLLEFLQDESKLAKLNENFGVEGPALLLGVDPVEDPWQRDEGETATAAILRSNYLGDDTNFTVDNQAAMIALLSDVHVLGPVDRAVRQLAGRGSLFYYSYRHHGSFSLPMALGIWESLGVSHMDELFLLFRCAQVSDSWLGDLAMKTDDDIFVSHKLVTLWTNFAKTGKPTEDGSWAPVTGASLEYAVVDARPVRMEYSPELAKRWAEVGAMFDLARKARAAGKGEHPQLEAMRRHREELFQQQEEQEREDKVKEKQLEKSEEELVEEFVGKSERTKEENVQDGTAYDFDPIIEMMKLVDMEVQEKKDFEDELRSSGVDPEEAWNKAFEHDEL